MSWKIISFATQCVSRSPPTLQALLFDQSDRGKDFHKHIRQYNSALSFTSLGYKKNDRTENEGKHGPWQCHGELYHLQSPLIPDNPESAQYVQLVFYDLVYATELRHRRNQTLNLKILRELTDMLYEINGGIICPKSKKSQPSFPKKTTIINIGTSAWPIARGTNSFTRISQNHPSHMPLHYRQTALSIETGSTDHKRIRYWKHSCGLKPHSKKQKWCRSTLHTHTYTHTR